MPIGDAYIPIKSNPSKISANMPDSGSTFPAPVVIDELAGVNWEASYAAFIDALAADLSDVQITRADGETAVPWEPELRAFSQAPGSRKLVLSGGWPMLSSVEETEYQIWRGVQGGPYHDGTAVWPATEGWIVRTSMEGAAGDIVDSTGQQPLTKTSSTVEIDGVIGKCQQIPDNTNVGWSVSDNARPMTTIFWIKAPAHANINPVYRGGGYDRVYIDDRNYDLNIWIFFGGGAWALQQMYPDEWQMCVAFAHDDGITNHFTTHVYRDGIRHTASQDNAYGYGWRGIEEIWHSGDTNGTILADEMRIIEADLSLDYLDTINAAENDNDSFWTCGAVKTAISQFAPRRIPVQITLLRHWAIIEIPRIDVEINQPRHAVNLESEGD